MIRELPLIGQVLMAAQLEGDYEEREANRQPTNDLDAANLITSIVAGRPGVHRPVLDIDLPVTLLPSSTPGHFHLFIDKTMPWDVYAELLAALANAGIIEPGYLNSAMKRGHTGVRLPWVRKGGVIPPPAPMPPQPPELQCIECVSPGEDPAPWCDCRPGETCGEHGPCRRRAHDPAQCPTPGRW